MDDDLIFDQFGEIEAWIANGKQYDWNGGFHVPIVELKKLAIEQLPINEKIQPIDKEDETYIIPSFPDLHLIRTEDGMIANIESFFHKKYWSHEVVSMQCFIKCLIEEIQSKGEFQLIDYNNQHGENFVVEYETKLVDVQSVNEAIKTAVHSLKSLEKRVNWRIANKLEKWVKEIKR